MNQNKICLSKFSNPETADIYKTKGSSDGPQCGGCSYFSPFNADYGLCCHADSYHHLETVFEHFTCKNIVSESWSQHSFRQRPSPDPDMLLDYLNTMAKILETYKHNLTKDEKQTLLAVKDLLVKEAATFIG